MFCHCASKAASSRGGVVAAEHVLTAAAGVGNNGWLSCQWPVALRRLPTGARAAHCGGPHHHTAHTPTTNHKETPKYTNFSTGITDQFNLHGKLPTVALFTLLCIRYQLIPRRPVIGLTNETSKTPPFSFSVLAVSGRAQNVFAVMSEQCFLRRCDIGQMCLYGPRRANEVNVRRPT